MDGKINVAKVHPLARIPVKETEDSAGFLLHTVEDHVLLPGQRYDYDTGLVLEIPSGLYGRIAPVTKTVSMVYKYWEVLLIMIFVDLLRSPCGIQTKRIFILRLAMLLHS